MHKLASMSRERQLLLVGPSSSGKTALFLRFSTDHFVDEYDPTIESHYTKTVGVDGEAFCFDATTPHTLEIDERFSQQQLQRGDEARRLLQADGFVFCLSLGDANAIPRLKLAYGEADKIRSDLSARGVLVGTKSDLAEDRKVSSEELQRLGEELNLPCFEVSAKLSSNVEDAFFELIRRIRAAEGESSHASGKPKCVLW